MKKKIPLIVIPIVVLGLTVWLLGMAFKTWHIFTEGRIAHVEQVFNMTLPESAEPVRYKEQLAGQGTVIQELYITGLDDPSAFAENSLHGNIRLYAEMNTADDDTKARYKSEYWYDGTERATDIICVYESGYYYTKAYFFRSENGLYDVKFIR